MWHLTWCWYVPPRSIIRITFSSKLRWLYVHSFTAMSVFELRLPVEIDFLLSNKPFLQDFWARTEQFQHFERIRPGGAMTRLAALNRVEVQIPPGHFKDVELQLKALQDTSARDIFQVGKTQSHCLQQGSHTSSKNFPQKKTICRTHGMKSLHFLFLKPSNCWSRRVCSHKWIQNLPERSVKRHTGQIILS